MPTQRLETRQQPELGAGFPLDLMVLGLISVVIVGLLTVGLAPQAHAAAMSLQLDQAIVAALSVIVTLLIAAGIHQAVRSARHEANALRMENLRLQQRLSGVESIIRAEPQVLVYWEPGQPLSVIAHALTSVAGVPENHRELLRFGHWLQPDAAIELKARLDVLFSQGRAFNVTLKTRAGGHLEVEGRTAGGRAILRMRDLVGYKSDLARILSQHQELRRDIEAGRALMDSLPSPVWLKDSAGRISWVNKAYREAVDAESGEEIAARQIELLEHRQRQSVDRAVAGGAAYRERIQLVVGGERKPHELVVLPVPGGQAAVALDMTTEVQAQGALDRQSAAYQRTLDKVATAVAIFDNERRLTYFNDAYQRLWQLDAAWLKSAPQEGAVLDRLREAGWLPEDRNYRDWKAKFLSRIRSTPSSEELWHLPDGRTLQVLTENRGEGGVAYLFVDQTERLALESRFNEQIKAQRETLDSLKEGVAVFGIDGRLKFSNEAFASIWHLPAGFEADRPHVRDVIAKLSPQYNDPGIWTELLLAVTNFSDERTPREGTMPRADQTLIAFATTPLPDGATLLTFRDVTVAKRYERALEERNLALVAADRVKSQFIGHVSYELRTPLTNIIGFGELLSSPLIGSLNPKQREYLSDITASSKTLLSIIDDILDLATIDAGALELKIEPIDVPRLLDTAIEGIRDRALKAKLTLDIGRAEDAVTFNGDEARVSQVLYNLLSNAVGFSKPGDTIEVTAWREGGMMKFSVEDQGIGVAPDYISRVFERFESRSGGSKHRGAGLGLSLVKSLVDLHGGTVEFKSEPGRYTKVVVSFPERGERQLGVGPEAVHSSGTVASTDVTNPVFIPMLKSSLS